MNSNSSNYIRNKKKRTSKQKRSRTTANDDEVSVFGKLLKSSAYGSLFGFLVGLLVLLIASLVAYKTNDPSKLVLPLALLALYSASFSCGFLSSKHNNGQIILCGIFSTILLFCGLFIISRFLPSDLRGINNGYLWLIRLCIPVVGILGALAGAYAPKKQTKPKMKKRTK